MMAGRTKTVSHVENIVQPSTDNPGSLFPDAFDADLEVAIDKLGKILCDAPNDEKPGTIAALVEQYPELGKHIMAGKKKGLVDKALLQQLGILKPTASLLKNGGIRHIDATALAASFSKVVPRPLIEPDSDSAHVLPTGVIGVDVANSVELRSALIGIEGLAAESVSAGDTYDIQIDAQSDSHDHGAPVAGIRGIPGVSLVPLCCGKDIFADVVKCDSSDLSQYAGAMAMSVSNCGETCFAQFEIRWLANLSADTMVYALRGLGIVRDADLIGGMGWNLRMRQTVRGVQSPSPSAKKEEVAEVPNSNQSETPCEKSVGKNGEEAIEAKSVSEESDSSIDHVIQTVENDTDLPSVEPTPDLEETLLAYEDNVREAEAAYAVDGPFDSERLRAVEAECAEAVTELNHAGFFAFRRKKELKARIAALEDEHAALEKSRAAMAQIDDARKKLAQAKENAENEYKQRGLL